MTEKYLKAREAAAYIGSSESTLAKLRTYGGGPTYHKIGRGVRYTHRGLDTYMAERSVRSTSDKLKEDR